MTSNPIAARGGALLALAAILVACSSETGGSGGGGSSEPPPEGRCYEDPISCPDGTTCAFDDENGEAMSCLPAGSAGVGDECVNTAGTAECGERMACLHLKASESGYCTPFCGGSDDCASDEVCGKVSTDGGHSYYACIPG
jgi:hypothetical protein